MMLPKLTLLAAFYVCATHAVLNGNEVKRREAFDTYGPPRPAPQYGPPPQRVPHREYGVPQQIPFREYGPPALKYGPPKLNFLGGSSSSSSSSSGFSGGLHEQIKSHFGVPKPFYGPPHIQHKPASQYGPPPPQPAPQYGPPKPAYGPPPALKPVYGPPAKQQHRPAPNYGPPKQQYGPPQLPQALPSPHPAPLFQSQHQPATSYGPPPSGPLNLPSKPIFDAPPPNYGPPPLPISLPGPQPANFNQQPETTIIVSGGGHGGGQLPPQHGPVKQVQIQIDSSGHTHSVSGSQAPFHTACDGWKPIPAPVGAYVEHNNIETQSGYSHVAQGASIGTQYSGSSGIGGGIVSSGGGNSIVDGLTDEQLVTIALQGGLDNGNNGGGSGNVHGVPTGPAINTHLNSIESEALQLSLGATDDSYSKPPLDSFAPGSLHAQKYNTISTGPGLPPPGGNYGPPPPPPSGNYGPPPNGNYRPPPPPPGGNYGPPPPPPSGNYGPPPPSAIGTGPAIAAAIIQEQHHQQQQQQQQHQHIHHSSSSASSSSSAGLSLQYGVPSGNAHSFPPHNGPQPNRPVAYRPPVPQGLLESIGATVQHIDQFGVKPQQQPPTYIPPAANEIAQSGPELPPSPEYGAPLNVPPSVIEQQLPQPQPAQIFVQQQQLQQNLQQHQIGNVQNQYGPPPSAPQQQYLPPIPHVRPLGPPPSAPNQQYLPPPPPPAIFLQQQQQQHESHNAENAYSASQHSQQFVHTQGLPLPLQEPRFNVHSQPQQQVHIHDCGQGPNLVGGVGYQVSGSANVASAYQIANTATATVGTSAAYNAIAQSIPVAEQHTQFLAGPDDSYGPPPSGNINDIDHLGYASQKSSVTALPDGTDPQNLPGLDGLNVISAQKSQSIQLNNDNSQPKQTFQVQFGVSPNNQNNGGNGGATSPNGEHSANHEEILSQDLLQSILTAIEQPQQQQQHQQQHQTELPYNHKAQSRSDIDLHEDATEDDAEDETEPNVEESQKVEVRALPEHVNADDEEVAVIKEIKPIVAEDVEAKN